MTGNRMQNCVVRNGKKEEAMHTLESGSIQQQQQKNATIHKSIMSNHVSLKRSYNTSY